MVISDGNLAKSEVRSAVTNRSDNDVWGKTIPLLLALGLEALFVTLLIRF